MGILNLRVFNKSYMLEILENGITKEVFTFSTPPKSEDFDFGQRVTETKTFGGSVIDKYGNDTARIVLSGSTGNTDNKIIYRGLKKPPKYLDGEKEIFWLQKKLNEYHEQDKLNRNIDIFLYDLSKMNVVELATMTPSKNWWKVFIKDFKIKRDDSKPQFYNYTLEMIAIVEENETLLGKVFDTMDEIASMASLAVDAITSVGNITNKMISEAERTLGAVRSVLDAEKKLLNMDSSKLLVEPFKAAEKVTRSVQGFVPESVKNPNKVTRFVVGATNPNTVLYNATKTALESSKDLARFTLHASDPLGLVDAIETGKIQNSKTFTVMFDSNGGSSVARQTVEYSSTAEKPENPTRDEYAFDCWCSDRELATEYDFSNEVTGTMTLYAKWRLVVATVTFTTNFGSYVRPIKVTVGEKLTLPENPTKRGFIFKEWCTDIDGQHPFNTESTITGDLTLYAAWKDACSVTFDTDGGSEVTEQTVKIGGLVVYPITPTKENFTFSHWCSDAEKTTLFDFSRPITTNVTLYAVFVQTTNKVTFNSNGGSDVESQYVRIGKKAVAPPNPEKTGCDFVCWCTDRDCTNEFRFANTVVNSSMTLYAKWKVKELLVEFISDGNTFTQSQSVRYNERAIFPPIPTKDDFVFVMWQKRSEEKTVHTGRFETVILREEDGVTPKLDETTGEPLTESVEIMDYEYTEFDFNTQITQDLNLYAKWFGGE